MLLKLMGRTFNIGIRPSDNSDYAYTWRVEEHKPPYPTLYKHWALIGLGMVYAGHTYDDAVMAAFECLWQYEFSDEYEYEDDDGNMVKPERKAMVA